MHEAAVRQAMLVGSGVNANDPQRAELALFHPAVAVCVLAGLDDLLLCRAEHARAGAVIALGFLQ